MRQDLESPLYISDQLRLSISRRQLLAAAGHSLGEGAEGVRLSRTFPSVREGAGSKFNSVPVHTCGAGVANPKETFNQ